MARLTIFIQERYGPTNFELKRQPVTTVGGQQGEILVLDIRGDNDNLSIHLDEKTLGDLKTALQEDEARHGI